MIYYLYKITNLINNKIYIGIHKTLSLNDGYMGSGKLLKAAVKKYGLENFRKDILEIFDNEEDMISREQEIVNSEFILDESNYNIMPGGRFGSLERNGLSFKGKTHNIDTIEKIRNANIGKHHSYDTKLKMSQNHFSVTDPYKQREHARKAGSYNKSEEHKRKISESIKSMQKKGYPHPNLGKIRVKIECPHCGKTGAMNTMRRWHFDKCTAGG